MGEGLVHDEVRSIATRTKEHRLMIDVGIEEVEEVRRSEHGIEEVLSID